jgi:hypothetical protein
MAVAASVPAMRRQAAGERDEQQAEQSHRGKYQSRNTPFRLTLLMSSSV